MLQHEQIKQCVIEIRQAIGTGNEEKKELERQLTEVMVKLRDLQAGLRLAAELSQISWTEEQEREMQLTTIKEKAAAVLNGHTRTCGEEGPEGPPIPAEAACDEPCEAMAGHAD